MKPLFSQIKPKESEITKEIRRYLDLKRIFHWKNWQGPMSGVNGVSDIIGILPGGRFLAIEVKTDRGKATPKQERFIEEINHGGGLAFVARSVEDVMKKLGEKGWTS